MINSSGVIFIRPMHEIDTDVSETSIDLNLKGTSWGIASALPIVLAEGSGHLVNLASCMG